MSNPLQPSQLCPILTAGVMARPRGSAETTARVQVIGAQPGVPDKASEPEAVACQGPQCMWFVSQADPATGQIVGGHCSATAMPIVLGQLATMLAKMIADPTKQN